MKDYTCPHCGNTSSSEHGITLAWLEWMTCPVKGLASNGKVAVEYGAFESGDIVAEDEATVKNVPNVRADLEHYHCNKCGWNWFDNERQHDDADRYEDEGDDEDRKGRFADALKHVQFGHYHDVRFVRDYKGKAQTTQYYDGETTLDDPIDHPVDVSFPEGTELNAGVCNNGDGTVSLEIEGFDYGVGYVHGLTYEDIEIV